MRKLRGFIVSLLALMLCAMPILGCSNTPLDIKTPVLATPDTLVSENSNEQTVGLTAGFPLSHDSGLDRDNNEFAFYDDELYYLNDQKVSK